MEEDLIFDESRYEVLELEEEGKQLRVRAFEHIPYCANPADAGMQRLSVYVPEDYYSGKSIHGYDLKTAPVLLPNTVGGYMPGPEQRPGRDMTGQVNLSFYALLHGYVVVSAGVRGRLMKNAEGENIGTAPAGIVDLKAAVRYLKANRDRIPGDMDHIISNGTSAGGAMSALLGCTGDHPDYAPFLAQIGAADASDRIFASSCYCPITDLDHADMAYEWEFGRESHYWRMHFEESANPGEPPVITPEDGELTEEQRQMSAALSAAFPGYLNSLKLVDGHGRALTLDTAAGSDRQAEGTFRSFMADLILDSANRELKRLESGTPGDTVSRAKYDWIRSQEGNMKCSPAESGAFRIENGRAVAVDMDRFVDFRTRMKTPPAFDDPFEPTPEKMLFGNRTTLCRHFTTFSQNWEERHRVSESGTAVMAEPEQIRMMNPLRYIDDPAAGKAMAFRIRHGAVDRDTSLAVSEILYLKLSMAGISADIAHPWGINHQGDYDVASLFAWIDDLCRK